MSHQSGCTPASFRHLPSASSGALTASKHKGWLVTEVIQQNTFLTVEEEDEGSDAEIPPRSRLPGIRKCG